MQCPDSIEGLQELEKALPLCRITLYNQAKAKIEKGAAKSVSEASRQLAEETGKSANTIRSAINRASGTDAVHQLEEDITGTLSQLSGTDKHSPKKQPIVALGEAEIIREAKKINSGKALKKREDKLSDYKDRVEAKILKQESGILPNLILADPPWRYDFAETTNREIENHYNTENVAGMVDHIPKTQTDCILLMWATAPKLKEAFELMEAWNFEFKTCAVWDKEIIGMGYWFRGQHEILMVGTKGNVSPPLQDFRVSSVFKEKRTKHSKKPICVYEWIEKAFGDKEKLEMYCRSPRDGWSSWGNEI